MNHTVSSAFNGIKHLLGLLLFHAEGVKRKSFRKRKMKSLRFYADLFLLKTPNNREIPIAVSQGPQTTLTPWQWLSTATVPPVWSSGLLTGDWMEPQTERVSHSGIMSQLWLRASQAPAPGKTEIACQWLMLKDWLFTCELSWGESHLPNEEFIN